MIDPPFRRVLIANRGEVAVRIIRACRDLGMETVAIYSDADDGAMHARLADVAVNVGPPPPADSYLRSDAIVRIAIETRSDAVHPGYGFLAEQAAFARAVEGAGLTFVGPPSGVIDAVGDKLQARRRARDVGVPIVPGTLEPAAVERPDQLEHVMAEAREIGFPMLIKAAAGGGGRGMRRVTDEAGLALALAAGSHEAMSAFGDGTVYLEREIAPARHIEVQLLGDSTGRVVALGERDCSIQRRHQKLIEEAPAPGLTDDERRRLHEFAVRVGEAGGLRNAATAEFLYRDGAFWFLEVNTRLQVEHGVTELVSELDLVIEQFRLAAGEPLSDAALAASRRATEPTGHAIEVRLTAEDPGRDFAPTPGRIGRWVMPSGPSVRVDTALEAGERVPPEYDNLLAKILVHGPDRAAAIGRLRRALDETEVTGIQTVLPFHRFVASHPTFLDGELSTGWVSDHWNGPAARAAAARTALLAAGLAALEDDGVRARVGALANEAPAAGDRDARDCVWVRAAREAQVDRWPR